MSLSSALEQLATYRVQNSRASQDTFRKGSLILKNNAAGKMGNESALSRVQLMNYHSKFGVPLQVGHF